MKTRRTGGIPRPLLVALAAALPCLSVWACAPSDREFRSIGTGGTGGVYYPLGGALARELGAADSARSYTAEVTGGSVENVNRILTDQIDLGFALSVSASEGATTEGGDRLRVVSPLYPNLVHILVGEGAGVSSLPELAGKVVSVGSPGSGTEQTARQLLESAGLTYDDIEERYLSFTESAAALRDGALDAAVISVGYPAAAVLEATTAGGVKLLALDAAEVAELQARWGYYRPARIPAGVYPGITEPVPTVSMMNWIVARDDLPDEVARLVLEIVTGDERPLERVHDMARSVEPEALQDAPVPLHRGVAGPGTR